MKSRVQLTEIRLKYICGNCGRDVWAFVEPPSDRNEYTLYSVSCPVCREQVKYRILTYVKEFCGNEIPRTLE